jgi:hypothetical protein
VRGASVVLFPAASDLLAHARKHSPQVIGELSNRCLETPPLFALDFAASVFFGIEAGVEFGLGRAVVAEIMDMPPAHFGCGGFELGWRLLTVDKM